MVPGHHRQLAPDVLARHGITTPTDPDAMGAAYLHADVAADEPNPDAVARVYKEFMEAKQAMVNAQSLAWLPEFTDEDDCSLEMGDTGDASERDERAERAERAEMRMRTLEVAAQPAPRPASRAYDSATPAQRVMLDAVSAAAEAAVIARKAARETQAAGLEQYAVQWDMTPKPMAKDRFAAGYGREGLFPMNCLSIVGAPGGMGKTTLLAWLAVSTAVGHPFLGLETTAGATLFVSAEDGPEEMQRKVGALTAQLPADCHENAMQRVMVVCIPGDKSAAVTARYMRGFEATKMGDQVVAAAKALTERCGLPVRLIVFDHARLIVCGDLNDSEAVSAATRALNRVASATGAAVVMLAHSPKSSLSANRPDEFSAADVLGSGAMVDNARCAAVMSGLVESERKKLGISPEDAKSIWAFRVIKSNYSEAGRAYYMRKQHVPAWGVVVPVHVDLRPPTPAVRVSEDEQLDVRVIGLVTARPGQLTKNKVIKDHVGTDGPLRAGKPAVAQSLSRLLATGRLAFREPTPEERAKGGLTALSKEVLYVPA